MPSLKVMLVGGIVWALIMLFMMQIIMMNNEMEPIVITMLEAASVISLLVIARGGHGLKQGKVLWYFALLLAVWAIATPSAISWTNTIILLVGAAWLFIQGFRMHLQKLDTNFDTHTSGGMRNIHRNKK